MPTLFYLLFSAVYVSLHFQSNRDLVFADSIIVGFMATEKSSPGYTTFAALVTLQTMYRVAGVIGPDCSAPCQSAGLLASQWNIPLVGYVAQTLALSDKTVYNTFVRSNPFFGLVSRPMVMLMKRYNWTTVGVIIDQSFLQIVTSVVSGVNDWLPRNNITICTTKYVDPLAYKTMLSALQDLSKCSRGWYY